MTTIEPKTVTDTALLAAIKEAGEYAMSLNPSERLKTLVSSAAATETERLTAANKPAPPMTATTQTTALTFEKLAEMEPALKAMEREILSAAQDMRGQRVRCANKAWYGPAGGHGFKDWLITLVGWHRRGRANESAEAAKVLAGSDAYDACYEFLYGLLPDCKRCSCL